MKRILTLTVLMTLALAILFTTDANAQNGKGKGMKGGKGCSGSCTTTCTNFVDANGDGICDKKVDGTCIGCQGNGGTKCANFVDANGDGVCDNKGTDNCSGGQGKGMKGGKGNCGGKNKGTCSNTANQANIFDPYPNPFNQSTTLSFEILSDGIVNASVYDETGNLIKEYYNGNMTKGTYNYTFNPENLNSGRYFFKVKVGEITNTKPIIYTK
jgi:hypothetical protein